MQTRGARLCIGLRRRGIKVMLGAWGRRPSAYGLAVAVVSLFSSLAKAAPAGYPADADYKGSFCGSGAVNDPAGDFGSGGTYKDIIGNNAGEPSALQWYADATYVYFRMRLAQTPALSGDCTKNNYLQAFGWGVLIDFDKNPANYEAEVLVDWTGARGVYVFANDATRTNSFSDAPATPAVASFTDFCNDLSVDPVSSTADTLDHYLTMRITVASLLAARNQALDPDVASFSGEAFALWGGTSNNGSTLTEDSTCFANNSGTPTLSATVGTPMYIGTYVDITSPANNATLTTATPTISGNAEDNVDVTITIGGNTATVQSNASGAWSYTVPAGWGLTAGSYTVTAEADDGTSTDTVSHTFTISIDSDGDSFPDSSDNCPSVANNSQTDTDNDGDGDACDNCVSVANADQADSDGDLYGDACDCDDNAAAIHPGAQEICDASNVDEDCDGGADDADTSTSSGSKTTFYQDLDGDGYGSSTTQARCDAGGGYVAASGDCNDNSSSVHPGAQEICDPSNEDEDCDGTADDDDSSTFAGSKSTFHRDADSDGYGSNSLTQARCDAGGGYITDATDCDDSAASINPAATEGVGDGVDQNCDGQELCFTDADQDGFRSDATVLTTDVACNGPQHASALVQGGDCNDNSSSVHPGAQEICDPSNEDEDCDGTADDDDSSTFAGSKSAFHPDADSDGYGSNSLTQARCDAGGGYIADGTDCDDSAVSVNPAATEGVGDGVDQNCDGQELCFSDADQDGFRSSATVLTTDVACNGPQHAGALVPGGDCNDSDAAVKPGVSDGCNGVDDDCDGAFDEDFVTASCTTGLGGACEQGTTACSNGSPACQPPSSCGEDPDLDGICTSNAAVVGICAAGPDNCPTTANANQANTDGDGSGDACDSDDDGDGLDDASDNCPLVPNVEQTNTDAQSVGADAFGDACDDDDDGDGVTDGVDNCPLLANVAQTNTDGDGNGDACDVDDDNDGVGDDGDTDDLNPALCGDTDADSCDDCAVGTDKFGPQSDTNPSADGADRDSDRVCDAGDPDDDNDGVCDGESAVQGLCAAGPDTAPGDAGVCADTDRDGCDDCARGGFHPEDDGCVPMVDTDGDGVEDEADLDDDNDGLLDTVEQAASAGSDADGDGLENRVDLDSDNDGIADVSEAGLDAYDADGNGLVDGAVGVNGYADELESAVDTGTSRVVPIDTDGDGEDDFVDLDSDADGRFDIAEVRALAELDADADGRVDDDSDADRDGLAEAVDADDGVFGLPEGITDPRATDSDGDGIPNAYDAADAGADSGDSDGDGTSDADECPSGWPCRDADRDGVPDYASADEDGDGVPSAQDLDDDNDGILDTQEDAFADGDADGIPNRLDLDSDDDGVFDADESGHDGIDRDHNGVIDGPVGANGVPDSVEQDGPDSGQVAEPIDSDGDSTPDFLDADDDDDGVPTKDEGDEDRDGDGTLDRLDSDDDDDGIPTEDEREDEDGDGTPDYLEPPTEEPGKLAGGALCAVQPEGHDAPLGAGLWLFALGALLLLRRRKGRSAQTQHRAASVGSVLLLGMAGRAEAQVALDQFKPAPLATDGFALSRPDVLKHGQWNALVYFDYANDPLVYERASGGQTKVVDDHLVAHVSAAVGLGKRSTLFGMLPVSILMVGDDLPPEAPKPEGAGLGDLALGARLRLVDGKVLGLSAELIARLPTAELANRDQYYSGDKVGSYEPALLTELRAGRFDVRLRVGARLRKQIQVGDLELGQELVLGLGARLRIAGGLYAHAEVYGSTFLNDAFDREHTPIEILIGPKYHGHDLVIGAAAGPGLRQGYGSPDVRIVGVLGYAPAARVEEKKPTAPKDRDGDGLFDPSDQCPTEPEDFDGFLDSEGCPDPDNDQDGVLDASDQCPLDSEDKDNFEDENGCPETDNDQDGLIDEGDRCPNEPEDKDNFEDENGCPDPDNDQDGVLDGNDECPLAPGVAEAKGCPRSVRVDIEKGQITILDRVEFATGKDVILEQSMPILEEVHKTLAANPQLKRVRVEGHTDDRGRRAKNVDLSQRRARSVARWLVEHGMHADRLEAYGCGPNRPLASNANSEGRQQNRRVEFHIVDPAPANPRSTEGCTAIDLK